MRHRQSFGISLSPQHLRFQGAADTAVTDKAELDKLVKSSADSLAGIKTDFEKNVKSSLDELGDSMGDTRQ